MPFRKLLLRLMLASLAFSAVAGILAIFVAGTNALGRVIGTGVLVSIASGVMFGLSILTVMPTWRWTAIVALASCGIGAAAIFAGIWWDFVFPRRWSIEEAILGCAFMTVIYGGVAACSLANVGLDRRSWRWIGVVAAAVAFVLTLLVFWEHALDVGLAIAIATGVAVIVAHANMAFLCDLTAGQKWVRWGSMGAVIATAALIAVFVGRERRYYDDNVQRAAAAFGIAAASGSFALLVLSRLNRKITRKTIPTNVKTLTIVCPWCELKQSLPIGASSCGGCRLKFQISVEEPRCPNCEYLLYLLDSDRCPECGTLISVQAETAPIVT